MFHVESAPSVTMIEEIQIDDTLFASRQSNGTVVLANFPTSQVDSGDLVLNERHLDLMQQQKLLQLLQRALAARR